MVNMTVAPPRFVPVTHAAVSLARATLRTRDLAIARATLRESIGRPHGRSWQDQVRDWLATDEAKTALQAASLPANEETYDLLLGCERWPIEIWHTNYEDLRHKFSFDLYRLTVIPACQAV